MESHGSDSIFKRFNFVELEGVEPSSKRGTNKLSTCVVSALFSNHDRPGRPIMTLVPKTSIFRRNNKKSISDIHAPPNRLVSERRQSGDVPSLQLLQR